MDLNWFRDLSTLARTGNFSQAAELSHISQSAFSRRIKALESWVGATLVDRSKYPVRLTAAGRQMLEAGVQALERIENERDQIRASLEQPDRYVVTFGAQHSIAWRFFPSWLQSFEQSFGPILSRLRADNLPNCLTDLERGEVDFVVAYASEHSSGIEHVPEVVSLVIGSDQLIPVSRPDASGAPMFPLEFPSDAPIPYLRFGPDAPIGRHVEPVLAARRVDGRLRPVYENSMAGALRIRARDGLGVAWLPRSLVGPDLDSGLLTVAGEPDWWFDVEIRLHRLESNRNRLIHRIWKSLDAGQSEREPTRRDATPGPRRQAGE